MIYFDTFISIFILETYNIIQALVKEIYLDLENGLRCNFLYFNANM